MMKKITLDCLVDKSGKPITIEVDGADLAGLEEIRKEAYESGKRFRKAFEEDALAIEALESIPDITHGKGKCFCCMPWPD